jgi:hypothetical protein
LAFPLPTTDREKERDQAKNKPNALKRMQALLHRLDHAALARGVAFVLLEIELCGVGFAYGLD